MYLKDDPQAPLQVESEPVQSTRSGAEDQAAGTEPLLIQRQRTALRDLGRLITHRADAEPRLDLDFKARDAATQEEFDVAYRDVIIRFASGKEAVEREFEEAHHDIAKRSQAERTAAEQEFTQARESALERYECDKESAKSEFQEAGWTITAVFEGGKNDAERNFAQAQQHIAAVAERVRTLDGAVGDFLQKCGQSPGSRRRRVSGATASPHEDALRQLQEAIASADFQLSQLKSLTTPKWLKGERLLLCFVALWLLSLVPSMWAVGWFWGLLGSLAGAGLLGLGVSLWLYALSKSQVSRICGPLCRSLSQAESLLPRCREQALLSYHRQLGESKRRYNKEIRQVTDKYYRLRDEIKQRRLADLQQAKQTYRRRRAEIKAWTSSEWSQAVTKYRRLRAQIQETYETDSRKVQEKCTRELADSNTRHTSDWNSLVSEWQQGLARFHSEITQIKLQSSQLFPDWTHPSWKDWVTATSVPPLIRFGEYQVDLARIANGLPQDERLKTGAPCTSPSDAVPALLPFIPRCSLLIEANDEGRSQAVQSLQAVMFRMLTAIPPGKVRFVIIDPVGLGQNFATFMHLTDYDESLVSSRIWTEPAHIEQRLADLTAHMENVIQKYLRNQFQTIEEYNAHAGEVAEPYRILVVANFPANFSTEATRRLVSIMHSGARCGVHTLVSVDTKQPLPLGFSLTSLEQSGVHLAWSDQRFGWRDDDFAKFALTLDAPPSTDLGTRILRQVGETAKHAKRVEVPFEFVAPAPEHWWTGDSRHGIQVPLGRVGASKRQHLHLGHGTAQHVLIAGKTGSGKSTLLHALISNLALIYSPEEVELYLVDFKKGVEFKTYASHELPHARVVAIESEREFGLSVLQRLDAELKHRAERFRALGSQDLRAYRQANGDRPVPRILLIVDEFQEFFVEDDKIAQEAALLLDRLVRQGRAFGLHVLLGSQTLGGAYTLARSTIDQMAIRIALQCSEADAHLILSEDNSAARLLSRPGEAIYNDANGLVEGNNPFQVVWLDEECREQYLEQVQELAKKRNQVPAAAQIVFEGSAPADLAKNEFLHRLLVTPSWPSPSRAAQAWLGEAIAIKDPTAAVFRRQSGSNLLIIGQNDEAALGIQAACLLALAAQHSPSDAPNRAGSRFYVLDGGLEDAPSTGLFARLWALLPHPVRVVGWRELPAVIAELTEEVERRQKGSATEFARLYLFVYGLQSLRDLRRQEDDFSFSRREEERPSSAKQFGTLLREGPAVGLHTLLWCDSLNNLHRALDRQALREFEMRVLFQMSATDSSNLIDTPLASKLGLYRALFHHEERGRLEKFRPYGLPSETWLEWLRQQLSQKRVAEL